MPSGKTNGASQHTLFEMAGRNLLVFLDMANTSETMFLSVIEGGIVRVFDLRVAPRFDVGRLNRARVFCLFDSLRISYFDIPGNQSILSRYDVRLNPESIAPIISPIISKANLAGPNLFLLEDDSRTKTFAQLLPKSLHPTPKRGWKVFVPQVDFSKPILRQVGSD